MSNLSSNKQALFGNKTAGGTATNGGANPKASTTAAKSAAAPSAPTPTPQPAPVSKTAGMSLKSSTTSSNTISMEDKRKKLEEAKELSEKGMNALKTSLFQWSPDHLSASTYFERSANLYKQAGELKTAIVTMLKAADSSEAAGTLASAAIARTKAGDWAKEKGNIPKAIEFYEKAAETWGLHGDLQKYGETLIKVAKEYEESDTKKAKEVYFKALEVLCPKNTPKEQLNQCHPIIVDILRNLMTFLVKAKYYSDAIAIAGRIVEISQVFDIESNMCKALASITVLQLTMGDVVKAQQTYLQEHLSNAQYIKSKECELIDLLVMACNQQDMDLLDKAKLHPQVHFLDFEIQKLIKNISLFGFEDNNEEPALAQTVAAASKASLFQTKATPKPSAKAAPPAPAPVPAPAPPAPTANVSNHTPPPPPAQKDHVEDIQSSLDNLHVDEDHGFDELDHLNIEEEPETSVTVAPASASAPAPPPVNDDEDELDLS